MHFISAWFSQHVLEKIDMKLVKLNLTEDHEGGLVRGSLSSQRRGRWVLADPFVLVGIARSLLVTCI